MSFHDDRNRQGPWGSAPNQRPRREGPASGGPPSGRPRFGLRLVILAGVLVLAFILLFEAFPPAFMREGDEPRLVQYGLIVTLLLMSLAASRRSLANIAGQLLAWAALALVIVALYGYRHELTDVGRRVLAELVPTRGEEAPGGAMSFTRSADQQFWIDALVNGTPVRFLVDTGASSVVLNLADAARLGFPASNLNFTQTFQTANGRTRGAPVTLKEIRIGTIRFDNIEASVNEGELSHSLLGMHLLEKLSSIEIKQDRLIIRP